MASAKRVICDTGVMIRLLRQDSLMVQELDKIGYDRCAVSPITVAELYAGMKKGEMRQTRQTLNKFDIYELDPAISRCFLDLMLEHYLKRPGLPDMVLAATSLVYMAELFTLNTKDFDFISGLTMYRPVYNHFALK